MRRNPKRSQKGTKRSQKRTKKEPKEAKKQPKEAKKKPKEAKKKPKRGRKRELEIRRNLYSICTGGQEQVWEDILRGNAGRVEDNALSALHVMHVREWRLL